MRKKIIVGLIVLLVLGLLYYAYMMLAVRGTFAPIIPADKAGGDAVTAGIEGHRIVGRMHLEGEANASAPLVVILHGDAPFAHPRYQYGVAADIANAAPGTRVVALMRPGYTDAYGAHSDGEHGSTSGDNYTPEAVKDLADAIAELKTRFHAPSVLLLGHSGGATMSANIAALSPRLVQHVYLAACPCDVPPFRKHMAQLQTSPVWLFPVRSLSPLQTLDQMQPGVAITAISGSEDPLALPVYARDYVAKAKARGFDASMVIIPGKGHEILDEDVVIKAIADDAKARMSPAPGNGPTDSGHPSTS
ncbi:alpha/beta hydrolase [Pinirhizobacter soli]|uniref:alpha/beta hydrolase n=1 Tax=Pinirhizobacter soli TaxID=2786953 RepID=UPI002029B802|nr:alpha/beta fold hydrolase [Pinirhizobacter soli]